MIASEWKLCRRSEGEDVPSVEVTHCLVAVLISDCVEERRTVVIRIQISGFRIGVRRSQQHAMFEGMLQACLKSVVVCGSERSNDLRLSIPSKCCVEWLSCSAKSGSLTCVRFYVRCLAYSLRTDIAYCQVEVPRKHPLDSGIPGFNVVAAVGAGRKGLRICSQRKLCKTIVDYRSNRVEAPEGLLQNSQRFDMSCSH